MNEKFKKVLKTTGKVAAGFFVFAGTLIGGYMITPNRTKLIDIFVEEAKKTPFELFVAKLKSDVGMKDESEEGEETTPEEEKTPKYMNATLNNVHLQYKTANSDKYNTVAINGNLDFRMSSFTDIDFNVDLDIDYNGKHLPLEVGMFNNEIFFGLKDLRLKCTIESVGDPEEYSNSIIKIFDDILGADKKGFNYQGMYDDFTNYVTNLLKSDISLDSLISLFSSGEEESKSEESGSTISFSIGGNDEPVNGKWIFPIEIISTDKATQKEEKVTINIISSEDYTLEKVEIVETEFKGLKFGGEINFTINELQEFVSPAERLNSNGEKYNYIEMFHYSGWLRKLADFFAADKQKFGLNFNANLDYSHAETKDNVTTTTEKNIMEVEGSINIDLSQILDLEKYYDYVVPTTEEGLFDEGGEKSNFEQVDLKSDIQNFLSKVKEETGFNFQLNLNQIKDNVKTQYANLTLSLQDQGAFLIFNEDEDENGSLDAVMKLIIDTETMNKIVEKIPALINAISGDSEEKSVSSLFSFLEGSEVKAAIDEGDYSFILDMISELSNDETKINLGLDLSALKIGDNANVRLTLDSSEAEDARVLDMSASDIEFGDYRLNLNAFTGNFNATRDISEDEVNSFDKLSFVPSVLDQVTDLVQNQKAGFAISGSVKDKDNLGIDIRGTGKFDNGEGVKAGFGTLYLDQYKYNANSVWCQHKIALDIDNSLPVDEELGNLNEVMFNYSTSVSNGVLKGKTKIQSVIDIYKIIKNFIDENENNPKFTKFIAPITELLGVAEITNVISEKDYVQLASRDVVKKIAQFDNGKGLEIVVGGSLLGLNGDLTVRINFKGNNTSSDQSIESLEIINLRLGKDDSVKTINLKISLLDYDSAEIAASSVNRNDNFVALDGLKTLISMGINTTELNYFHLNGTVELNLYNIITPTLDVSAYVKIVGEKVWVYGIITGMPVVLPIVGIGSISEDYQVTIYSQKLTSEFTFVTYSEEENPDNKVGGYFDIKRTYQQIGGITGSVKKTSIHHYRATSDYFLDHIVEYLMGKLLGLSNNVIDKLGNLSSNEEKAPGDYANLFTSKGFSVTGNTAHTINAGINLKGLTNVSELSDMNIKIVGKQVGEKELLNTLHVDTSIKFGITLDLTDDFTLVNAGVSETQDNWNKVANAKFNSIYNISVSNMSGWINNLNSYVNY